MNLIVKVGTTDENKVRHISIESQVLITNNMETDLILVFQINQINIHCQEVNEKMLDGTFEDWENMIDGTSEQIKGQKLIGK